MNLVYELYRAGYVLKIEAGGHLRYNFNGHSLPDQAPALLNELRARKKDVLKYMRALDECAVCEACPACAFKDENLHCFGFAYFEGKPGIAKPCRDVVHACKHHQGSLTDTGGNKTKCKTSAQN